MYVPIVVTVLYLLHIFFPLPLYSNRNLGAFSLELDGTSQSLHQDTHVEYIVYLH